MKTNLFEDNMTYIVNTTNTINENFRYTRRCLNYLQSLIQRGIKADFIDEIYDRELYNLKSLDSKTVGFPFKQALRDIIMSFIAKRCQGIVDSHYELMTSSKTNEKAIETETKEAFMSWEKSLVKLRMIREKYHQFLQDWVSMIVKMQKSELTVERCEFYLDELHKKIALSPKDRKFLKRLNIDYRFRISGTDNTSSKKIACIFTIKNIRLNVFRESRVGTDNDLSYEIPYGPIDSDGNAGEIKLTITYDLYEILKSINAYADTSEGYERAEFNRTSLLYTVANPFRIRATTYVESEKGKPIYFPFLERWGHSTQAPCFGNYDSDIYKAIHDMSFIRLGTLLRTWVSQYSVGITSPYHQPGRMHAGIPKEWGPLAIEVGQDTRNCRRVFIDKSSDCDKYNCFLREPVGDNSYSACSEYSGMKRVEKEIREMEEAENELDEYEDDREGFHRNGEMIAQERTPRD